MPNIEISLTDNSDLIKDALEDQLEQALIAIGLTAESYAKRDCPVDTGRLRNSITFALAGQPPNVDHYEDDSGKTYSINGIAPNAGGNEHSVYIGTNVEYAQFVENGTARQKAQPFLRPAAANHTEEYKNLVKQALSR